MLDRARVLAKLDELEGYLRELEHRTPPALGAYQADLGTRLAVERLLHISIECLLDIGEVFVQGLRLGLPESEAGLMQRLEEAGVLEGADLKLLKEMQRFRNVLVHRYGQLDAARVHANALRGSREFRRLGRAFRAAADAMAGK